MAAIREGIGLLRGLWSREVAFTGPFAVTLDVTRRCNLRCVGCVVHSPYLEAGVSLDHAASDVDVEMVAALCREMAAMGSRKLVLCGQGEPLLHPRLFDLIRLGKSSGLCVMLITNGTLFNQETAGELVNSGLDLVRVTLWAGTREEWEANYPGTKAKHISSVPDALRLIAAVKEAAGSTLPRVSIHMVINRLNHSGVMAFASLAREGRVDAVSFSPLHTVRGPLAELSLNQQEERMVVAQLRTLGSILRAAGMEENSRETIRRYEVGADARSVVGCYVPWTHPRVRVDGTINPCGTCNWSVGNLREQSLREIWNGPAYRSFRQDILGPSGPGGVDGNCDCTYCCHFSSNERIHRVYRWLAPLARVARG